MSECNSQIIENLLKKVNKEALSPDQVDEEALAAFKREQVKT